MSKLPFIYRAENKEDAEWLADILQEKFGYWSGTFIFSGLNVRGQDSHHEREIFLGYIWAVLDIKRGKIQIRNR